MMLLLAVALQLTPLDKPDAIRVPPTRQWLVGVWLTGATRQDLDRKACNGGTVNEYLANGRTRFMEGRGRWSLSRNRLSETITVFNEPVDGELAADLNRPIPSQLIRVGPHEAIKVFADGHRMRMLRCRLGDRK